jgi:transcriptional regulator with XRE-family HTH domain
MPKDRRTIELGHFLRDRRGRVLPEDVGLPSGSRRRVSGLRREEVATLAGVGITWYTMLENGTADGVSALTLDAIGRALRMSEDELLYLRALAHPEFPAVPHERPSDLVMGVLAAIVDAPAYVATSQWNVLAWNRAFSLVWNIEPPGGPPFNIVRRMFLDGAIRAMHGERFRSFAFALVAMLHAGTARRMDDPVYRTIYDDLIADPVFAEAWKAYTVAAPVGSIRTTIESPNAGVFSYEAVTLVVPGDAGHSIVVQVPDAGCLARLLDALHHID